MIILWSLSVLGAYYLGKDGGINKFFGIDDTPPDRRNQVLDKWVSICIQDEKKTARTAIHAINPKHNK